jgi:sugar phosphate permease
VAYSMQTWGWRPTAFVSGIIVIVLGFPLARVFRRRPEDSGETVDGLPPAPPPDPGAGTDAAASAQPAVKREFTAREALRTPAFWFLSLGHGFALLVVFAVNVHAIAHMKESLGFTLSEAAYVITLVTVSQLGGIMLGWWIGDRYDKRFIAAACMLGHAAGLLMLTYAGGTGMLVAFAVLHGGAWGVRGPFMQAIRADYFGRRAIGMILGLSSLVIVIGQIGGPLIAGLLADLTGNYRAGFTVIAALAAMGSLFFLLARRPS